MSNETKVGFFVVMCIVLALGLSMMLGDVSFKKKGILFTVVLPNAAGLVEKTDTQYLGTVVGVVESVAVVVDHVEVQVRLRADILIPNNVSARVSQDGLLGQKFLELVPNSIAPTDNLQENDRLTNYIPTVSVDDLITQINAVATDVGEITSALSDTFATDEAKADMRAILTNLRDGTESLKEILVSNQEQIGSLVTRLNNIAGTVDGLTTSREADLHEIVTNLKDMSASMKSFSGNLDGLLNEGGDDVAETITNLRSLTAKAQTAVDNINRITQGAADGEGTIGMLLTDNETRDSLKNTIGTLGEMVEKANRITVTLEGSYEYLTDLQDHRGRFDVKIQPSPQRYYLFGVANNPAGVTSKSLREVWVDGPGGSSYYTEREYNTKENPMVYSVQYAYIFNKLFTLRGGIFDSRLGAAIDVHPLMDDMERLKLTLQASDFDREEGVYVKFNTRYRFMDNFFVQAGWDDIGTDHSNFTAGGGIILRDDDIKSLIGSLPMPSMN